MSNLWLNVRFKLWHLQAGYPRPWSFRISRNDVHSGNPRWFELYELSIPRWRRSE